VASGDLISITEMVNLDLDLARVRPIEKKSHPASEERSSLRLAVSDQLDLDRKRA
jgi:hypothetical protein